MMLVLQIEGYSKQALATLIAMLRRIEIARANAVLHRATTMKTSLTAAAVIATLTLSTAHAETVTPHTVIPHIADVSHAETATADFFYRFFTAKSQKNLNKTMSFFSRDLKTYTAPNTGWHPRTSRRSRGGRMAPELPHRPPMRRPSTRVMACSRMRRSEYKSPARPPSAGTSAALGTTFPMGLAQSHGMSPATTKEAAWNGSRILKRACVLV